MPAVASVFLDACRGNGQQSVPVWFMRQAGRSLPEYRAIRTGLTMLDSCAKPDLVAEITLQPVRRYGVDAAIFYSDIMVPLRVAGVDLDIVPGTGPVIGRPIRTFADLDPIQVPDAAELHFIADAVRLIVTELDGSVPLIGFAGAPFTLASYLVEGGPSRDFLKTKALMVAEPKLWRELCTRLAAISAVFLRAQVDAGAAAIQLFDSWAGALSAADYVAYAQPYSAQALAAVADVPRIHFGVGTGELLTELGAAGADVVGVDWRVPLAEANDRLGGRYPLQGNLDPALLGAPWPILADRVRDVIRSGASAPGHVFNLGHGVPPSADPAVLGRVVDLVHAEGAELRSDVLVAAGG